MIYKSKHTRRILSLIMVFAMVLALMPASAFSAEDTITLYFRNDWLWSDVRVYAFDANNQPVSAGWPGDSMTFVENNGSYDIYSIELPRTATGIVFNGINDKSVRDQSPDILDFADGDAFYMHWNNKNLCSKFDYTPPVVDNSTPMGELCTVTLHFGNTLGWANVYLYSWITGGNTLLGNWPGNQLVQGADGFYSCTFQVPSGSNVNFIYSSGSNQTVDLSLGRVGGDVEKWIQLTTTDSEGKYYANQLTAPYPIALPPQVNGNSVTFEYVGDATSVAVAGTFNNWNTTANTMTFDGKKWSVTIDGLQPGQHLYKLVIDGDQWGLDQVNSWIVTEESGNQNSAFFLSDPLAEDENEIKVNITYSRTDGNYTNWNVYAWGAKDLEDQYDFDANHTATITLNGRDNLSLIFKVRKSVGNNDWAEQSGEIYVDLSKIVSGTVDVLVTETFSSYSFQSDVVMANKLASVELDYDANRIHVTAVQAIANAANALTLVKDSVEIPCRVTNNGTVYTLTPINDTLTLQDLHLYEIRFDGYSYAIGTSTVYASQKFAAEFIYNGTDLGAVWSANSTTFTLWAPTATAVSVNLYESGTAGTNDLIKAVAMTKGTNGTWTVTVDGNLNGTYYTYAVTRAGKTVEAVDPYTRTTGVNGQRGMVINLDSTDPEGWADDKNPNPSTSYTDAIIYELHVRDFSIDDSSGIIEDYQGKFLAFTQQGSTVPGTDISTGIDYLKALGVTHIHLLPVYDYGSVDETKCDNFNWGYDPVNYNVPEGSYSTDPYRAELRISEFKQMVMALHEAGISVIMDVVYNHVYNADKFCFNQIVPGYFSRVNSNASGCGNDTASEREMVSKYIVESVAYWCEEYHIDGFRFDLVGLIDVNTINAIVDTIHNDLNRPDVIFYGEGWDMDGTNREAGTDMAKQGNAYKTPGFAYFSDSIRNQIAGSNGSSLGFVSGGGAGDLSAYFMARPNSWGKTWTYNPSQVVQYASCHDNYTLIDKLVISTGASGITNSIVSMNNLSAVIYMTAQGIPFIHAGEEFLREKLEEDGGRCENSYNASDYVNHIEWSNLKDAQYADTVAYYKGLIDFRLEHPALRYDTAALANKYVRCAYTSTNVLAFFVDGYGANDDDIYIIFNANSNDTTVDLPEGNWTINIDKQDAGITSLGTVSGSVSVEGVSAMVLTKADEGEDAAEPGITLYFTNNQGWSNVHAYAWDANGTYLLGAWPGSAMTYVETNDYGQDIYAVTLPASAQKIIFHNNAGVQTNDLTVATDGTGYYCSTQTSGNWDCDTYTYRQPLPAEDGYYLFGYINGANYGCEEDFTSLGIYEFDENGRLTVTFKTDSYVGIKTGDNGIWYMTDGWQGNLSSGILYDSRILGSNSNKLMVPGGVEVTFTLIDNEDGTLRLSYECDFAGAYKDESGIQDGVTLHCWNWSFEEIEENMAKIAEMGFTAIQTSPVQPLKETTAGMPVGSNWWVYYQPVDFVINTAEGNALGTKAQLESMIETAHSYGIQVIVDVVANHLGNETGNDLSTKIPTWLQNSTYWHSITTNITDYTDRQDVTQNCMSGLPDLNTAHDEVQAAVLAFLKECVDAGVDGFRFDAAKHIETPLDDVSYASDFWPTVIDGAADYAETQYSKDLYFYGEVLDSIDGLPVHAYTQYMSVTDNSWGNTLRENISSGICSFPAGYDKAAHPSNLVIWVESHDTFANDDGMSKNETISQINLAWALVAARADAMGLYLSRPANLNQSLGTASTVGWYSPEVAAVNKFHNAFAGQDETLATSGNLAYVVRGDSGIVVVNTKGGAAAVNLRVDMADGTYTDHLSGNTFTVSGGKLTGLIGSSGIAVVHGYGVAENNGETYHSLEDAINHASQGDIIKLLSDTSISALELMKGITLDLNGKTLTVTSHVAAYKGNTITDSRGTGLLKVEKAYMMLQKDNGALPIWNGVDGYVFAPCDTLDQLTESTSFNTLTYTFLPGLSAEAFRMLAAGQQTSGVSMQVVVTWVKPGGTIGSTAFTYSDALMEAFYASYDPASGTFDQAFILNLTGVSGKQDLTFAVYFESNTGVRLECGSN